MIATPDQRVRVFVSSTLDELADERAAAREAIEELRLIPVLFELGARPHPPRNLYRSYLEQSDVFVGIYGERYGWVAPGMEISGLEDEYLLAAAKPKLLYFKRPAAARDECLRAFLERIKEDAEFSYRGFADAGELRRVLADDLAVLLSERFQAPPLDRRRARVKLPAPIDRFIGREAELGTLERQLREGAARLTTVTGPGGVGKTRLALEAARRSQDAFADGAHFVSLSAIVDAGLVARAIQASLELSGSVRSAFESLVEGLRDTELLLVLDNFEHLVSARAALAQLLEECPHITLLVTSRAVLNMRGEREFRVPPLSLPRPTGEADDFEGSDAVALFVERARAVNPAFSVTRENRSTIVEICRRLDALPLAIELAASQARLLPPESILGRLGQRLGLAVPAGWAYPERQQTLRAAMDWSFELLDESEKTLFARASVFRGGWTLEALDIVGGIPSLEVPGSLVEKSLVVPEPAGGEPRFSMLPTIRDYAAEKLEGAEEGEEARERHAAFYLELIREVGPRLGVAEGHSAALARLDREEDNVRAAVEWLLQRGDGAPVADAGWWLLPYWTLRERLAEGRRWMVDALASGELPERARARALAVGGALALRASDSEAALRPLKEALAIFRALGDETGIALAQLPLGVFGSIAGDRDEGLAMLEDSRRLFERVGHEWGAAMTMFAMSWTLNATRADAPIEFFEDSLRRARTLGWETETMALGALARRRAIRGESGEAKRLLAEALGRVTAPNATIGAALYLDLLGDLAANEGEDALAARLSASAEVAFAAGGSNIAPLARERALRLASVRERLGDSVFTAAWEAGRARGVEEATAEALAWAAGDGRHVARPR